MQSKIVSLSIVAIVPIICIFVTAAVELQHCAPLRRTSTPPTSAQRLLRHGRCHHMTERGMHTAFVL